jgi:hypothetical protein
VKPLLTTAARVHTRAEAGRPRPPRARHCAHLHLYRSPQDSACSASVVPGPPEQSSLFSCPRFGFVFVTIRAHCIIRQSLRSSRHAALTKAAKIAVFQLQVDMTDETPCLVNFEKKQLLNQYSSLADKATASPQKLPLPMRSEQAQDATLAGESQA